MKFSNDEIKKLLYRNISPEENFDENAGQYEAFIDRIKQAAGKETVALTFVDSYGCNQSVVLSNDHALVSVDTLLDYKDIINIPELRDYPVGVRNLILDKVISEIKCDEPLENFALFMYEIIVPAEPTYILDALQKAAEFADFICDKELNRLQQNILDMIKES